MKRYAGLTAAVLLAIFTTIVPGQEKPAASRFAAVTAELDRDGDFLLYLSAAETMKLIEQRYPHLVKLLEADAARKGPPKQEETRRGLRAAESIVKDSGLGALRAIGASSKPIGEKLFRSRVVLYHEPGKGTGKFWRLLGTESRDLAVLKLLPQNTAFAAYGDFDLTMAWQWLVEIVKTVGDEQARKGLEGGLALMTMQGFDLEAMIKSTDGTFGHIITLNERRMMTIPVDRDTMEFPEPALLTLMKVKNDKIIDTLKAFWLKKKAAFGTERLDDDTVIYSFPVPVGQGLPFNVTPTVATFKDWLMIGSNTEIVRQALDVHRKKAKGLTSTPEFARLARDLPQTGNQFVYCSPKLTEYAAALVERGIRKENSAAKTKAIVSLLGLQGAPFYGCVVAQRRDTGMLITGNSNVMLSQAAITGAVTMPILVIAAAEGRAKDRRAGNRNQAQRKQNTAKLQQIGLGLVLYAGDHKGNYPAPDGAAGLSLLVTKDYLTGGTAYIHPADTKRQAVPGKINKLTENTLSYTYIGSGFKDNDPHAAITPVCFDKPGLGDGVTVLFIDGHVEFFEGNFPTRAAVIELLRVKKQLPDNRYRELLKKAKALDAAP